ncbi:hypothetical protein FRB99_003975 [Tulasnella sp. 403]|nr:hypothetical protein FRB99_003975 [Tulasnella sp. 403]
MMQGIHSEKGSGPQSANGLTSNPPPTNNTSILTILQDSTNTDLEQLAVTAPQGPTEQSTSMPAILGPTIASQVLAHGSRPLPHFITCTNTMDKAAPAPTDVDSMDLEQHCTGSSLLTQVMALEVANDSLKADNNLLRQSLTICEQEIEDLQCQVEELTLNPNIHVFKSNTTKKLNLSSTPNPNATCIPHPQGNKN